MPFNDFDVFWNGARAVLVGQDPYALYGVYYPLPMFFIFLPLAVLPLELAHALWTLVEALILIAILRKRAVSVILFMPVILTFLMGQIVLPILGLFMLLRSRLHGGVALGLLFLKPQLALFIAPWQLWRWWHDDRRQIAWFALTGAAMSVSSLLVQPDWVQRWMAVSGERLRTPLSASLWGALSFLPPPLWVFLAAVASVAVMVWAYRRNDLDVIAIAGLLVNPVIISYDLTMLTGLIKSSRTWLLLTLLSWICFAINAYRLTAGEGAFALTTLAILAVVVRQTDRRRASVSIPATSSNAVTQ